MPADLQKARELFLHAVGQLPPEQWEHYVVEACGGDAELEQQVGNFLRIHRGAGSFLERPAAVEATVAAPRFVPGTTAHRPAGGDAPGAVIGPYKLLQELGEGGMGTVYMAEQTHPVRRRVALKLIKAGMDSKAVLARFEAERQALALMDHPNIARVFDAGTTDRGVPYFVMELVKGMPITAYCDDRHLTCGERLELFIAVCHAVQHAHQKGIIHRDIKPSNVLVCLYDGKPVPKVIDFGVAKATGARLTDRTLFTAVGSVVGTLEYMSPEQAEINQLDVDTRSDVYSLGVLFYELLTGTTPLERKRCRASSFLEVLRLIREEEPPRPSTRLSKLKELPVAANRGLEPKRLSGLVRGELDWIAMKALEKDRNRRYETADGLAADVQRYLQDEPVQACPPSARYRFRKFARRNKTALVTATAAAVVLLTAVAGLATSTLLIAHEKRETAKALAAETRAKGEVGENLERERRDAYFHRIALAHRELSTDDLGRALELLGGCPDDLRGWEWHYLTRLCRVEPLVLRDATEVNGLAFSPDGGRIASAGGDGAVKIWDSKTGAVIGSLANAHPGYVSSVAFHPGGRHLASVGADKRVRVWDLATKLPVFTRPCDAVHAQGASCAVAFGPPDGQYLAAGTDGAVNVWDWGNDRLPPRHAFTGHERLPISVAFSRDGSRLASGTWQGGVRVWDPRAGGGPFVFPDTRDARHPACALAFSPDGGRLAAASFERRVDVWDVTGTRLHSLPHSGLVLCVAFSPDGRRIASGGEDKTVRLWDAATGREVLGLRGHTGLCGCVAFSPDGLRLASAGKDGTVRVWDANPLRDDERQEALTARHHRGEIWSVAISPDGRQVVSAGFNAPPMIWDPRTGEVGRTLPGHHDVVFNVAWDPAGERVASAGAERGRFTVKVWDARAGAEEFELPAETGGEYFSAAFSPDGRHLVTGRRNETVQVWDARTGRHVRRLGDRVGVIRGVVFSRDGKHLASMGGDGVVQLWDATHLTAEQKPRHSFQARHHGVGLNLAFSPDGRRLATGGKENTVIVWDVPTGTEVRTLRGHSGDIYTVAFSPDPAGRWVASAGEDSAVKVWDSRTGELRRSFRGHTGLVSSLAFTPDGRRLISGSRDHTVKVWDVTQLNDAVDR